MPERFEYSDTPSYAIQSAIHKYLFASKYVKNKTVLDIASGIGYGSDIIINQAKSAFLIAGDSYLEGIRFGKNSYHKEINFCNLSAFQLPFKDSSFDVIVSFETFEHLENLEKFLKEIHRILRQNGILICSTPNKKWSQRVGIENKFHLQEYTHYELLQTLSPYFKNIKSYGQLETASELLYKFPSLFKIYRLFRPIIARIFKVKDPKVVATKSLNPKFTIKEFWETSPYLIFVAEK